MPLDISCALCGKSPTWCDCNPGEFVPKNFAEEKALSVATHEKTRAATITSGVKYDAGKPEWHLLPWGGLTDIVKVITYGARKYAPDNWQRVSQARTRYIDAAFRHLTAWAQGEKNDPESGLPHLAHAGCCLLFLAWFDANPEASPQAPETVK